jgi:hypothetical protein
MKYNNINRTSNINSFNSLNLELQGTYELIYKRNNNAINTSANNSNEWEYHTFIRQLSPTIPEQKLNIVYLRSNELDEIVNNFINDNISNSRNPNIRAILIGEDILVIGLIINESNQIIHMRFGYYND